MANLTMKNWHIQDKLPYLNLGSAGESNASIVTITVDALIDDANYYLDIGDENGSGLPNTQELKTHTSVGTNGETVYTLSMQPLVTWLGREGVKLLQVRCVYEEDNEQVVKESNVFHAKVDRNSGFVYKYNVAVFEEYLEKIKAIVTKVINTLSLHSLTDVSIHHPQNNQVLTYDDELEKWKNKDIADFDYVTNDELSTTLDNYPTKSEITEDLEPYATKSEVSTTLESYETKQELNSTLESYATKTFVGTTLESYPTKSELNTTLTDYVTDTSLATTLESYVTNSDLDTTLVNYVTNNVLNTTLSNYSTTSEVNTSLNTKLDKISSLPTPSVAYLDKTYLLTSTQAGYQKGGIYQCVSDGASTPTYSWQLISSADIVEFTAQELQDMW